MPAGLCCLQTAHSKAFWAGLTLDAYPCGVPDHCLALMFRGRTTSVLPRATPPRGPLSGAPQSVNPAAPHTRRDKHPDHPNNKRPATSFVVSLSKAALHALSY